MKSKMNPVFPKTGNAGAVKRKYPDTGGGTIGAGARTFSGRRSTMEAVKRALSTRRAEKSKSARNERLTRLRNKVYWVLGILVYLIIFSSFTGPVIYYLFFP